MLSWLKNWYAHSARKDNYVTSDISLFWFHYQENSWPSVTFRHSNYSSQYKLHSCFILFITLISDFHLNNMHTISFVGHPKLFKIWIKHTEKKKNTEKGKCRELPVCMKNFQCHRAWRSSLLSSQEKSWTNWKATTLIMRETRSQDKLPHLNIGETDKTDADNITYRSRSFQKNYFQERKTLSVIDVLLETQCGEVQELKIRGLAGALP